MRRPSRRGAPAQPAKDGMKEAQAGEVADRPQHVAEEQRLIVGPRVAEGHAEADTKDKSDEAPHDRRAEIQPQPKPAVLGRDGEGL